METERHKRKIDGTKNMGKELQGLREVVVGEIHVESIRATFMKEPNWKTLGYDGIHGFWFLKIASI